jgi:uncharacterized membrane protein YdfJ with MMPL/SSD domain
VLERWGHLVHRRARLVLAAAVAVTVAAGAVGLGVAERLDPYGAEDPATESARADRLLERATGVDADAGVLVLAPAEPADRLRELAAALRRDPAVARVTGPADGAPVSADGRTALLLVGLRLGGDTEHQRAAERLAERFGDREGVRVGGSALANAEVNEQVRKDIERAELIAVPIVLLLSLLFFRSLVAAALPTLVAGVTIVLCLALLRGASELGSVSVFALNLVTGLGLGLAIDYALFVVSRYREELAARGPGPEALGATLAGAGRTVLFSGLVVTAALAALLVFPQRFLYSMGIGGVAVALMAVLVALTVLPAVLALLGPRVDALAPRRLRRSAARDARPDPQGRWARLARWVMRRPGRVALVTAAAMLALALPVSGIQFTQADSEVLPAGAAARTTAERVEAALGGGVADPTRLLVRGGDAEAVARRAADVPGVAAVGEPRPLGDGVAEITARLPADPQSAAAGAVVERLRALPGDVLVTGPAARYADLRSSLVAHLPLALAILLSGSLVLLFLMTGSVVLPVKTLALNALTIAATFGLLVLAFQEGGLEGILGFEGQGAIEITQPVLIFAVAFGLSTDYGVFLLARIAEARARGLPHGEAIAMGLERTGRIVTAAALLFAVAIGAFVSSEIIFVQELGFAAAVAVLLDATIVRALLVPSLMAMLGRRNWWAPAPVRRLHGRLALREA